MFKVVYYPPTLPAIFDNVYLDGTVYILPFPLKLYNPCIMTQPVNYKMGADFGSESAGK